MNEYKCGEIKKRIAYVPAEDALRVLFFSFFLLDEERLKIFLDFFISFCYNKDTKKEE